MKADGPRARPASRLRPRLLLLGLVTLALAPGTLLRTPTGNRREPAVVSAVALPDREGVSGPLRLTGVWEMESRHAFFGGFSALAFDGGTRLVAGTDLEDLALPAEEVGSDDDDGQEAPARPLKPH